MQTPENLNRVYKLYSEKQYLRAFILVQEILKVEPKNIYAKRYEQLLRPYLNDKSEAGKIATIKGKNLKCPHCTSAISLSALTEDQKTKIKNNDYENLSVKCPYCHTQFTLQKKSFASIIGIQIGDQIIYNQVRYRVVGGVDYDGDWFEEGYSDKLRYFEWILLGEDNSYLYFSEGYFVDHRKEHYEFEFSYKIIPNFSLEFVSESLKINGKNVKISEKNIVFATKLYGENSKVFTAGEKIELFAFQHSGKNYILEKESAGRQSEAGIYFTESISRSQAFEIFGKEYKENIDTHSSIDLEDFFIYPTAFIVLSPIIISTFGFNAFLVLAFLGILLGIFFFNKRLLQSKIFYILIIGPFFGIITFIFSQNIFESKQQIPLQNITEGKKFEIIFEDSQLKNLKETGYTKYDYGGIRTDFEEKTGLSFSIQSEEDKKIIEKIQNKDGISEELEKIFSEKIYKLR